MIVLMWAGIALFGVAAALAAALAMRDQDHRPVAWALAAGFVADLGRALLYAFVFPPPQPEPFTSTALVVAVGVDAALNIVWPAAVAYTGIRVFAQRRGWPVIVAWAAASLALALTYPATRGEVLRRCYLAADIAGSLVAFGCAGSLILRRLHGAPPAPRVPATVALLMASALFLSIVAGPHKAGLFGPDAWLLAVASNGVFFLVMVIVQGIAIWTRSRTDR